MCFNPKNGVDNSKICCFFSSMRKRRVLVNKRNLLKSGEKVKKRHKKTKKAKKRKRTRTAWKKMEENSLESRLSANNEMAREEIALVTGTGNRDLPDDDDTLCTPC